MRPLFAKSQTINAMKYSLHIRSSHSKSAIVQLSYQLDLSLDQHIALLRVLVLYAPTSPRNERIGISYGGERHMTHAHPKCGTQIKMKNWSSRKSKIRILHYQCERLSSVSKSEENSKQCLWINRYRRIVFFVVSMYPNRTNSARCRLWRRLFSFFFTICRRMRARACDRAPVSRLLHRRPHSIQFPFSRSFDHTRSNKTFCCLLSTATIRANIDLKEKVSKCVHASKSVKFKYSFELLLQI